MTATSARAEKRAAKAAAKAARQRGEMSLIEHLRELRSRLFKCVLAVAGGAVIGWFLFNPVLDLLIDPYKRATGDDSKLVFLGVAEPFLIKLKVAAYLGIAFALPVILYQLWRFVTPGLYPKERRYALPFVVCSVLLFALGAFFAWLTFPTALKFLIGFGGPDLQPFLSAERYINFVFLMALAFGVSFELPILLQFLVIAGLLSSRQLRHARRWAFLLIAIFAAIITPSQDPFSMLLMAVPMAVFYEAVIWISRLVFKK